MCIIERPGGSAHLLGGIHRLTSSRQFYHRISKAQGMIFADFPQISRSGSADFPPCNPCRIRKNENKCVFACQM